MAMRAQAWKSLLAVIVVATGAAIAIPLARYAERDDAPDGVLTAVMIFVAAAALAAWIANRPPQPSPGNRTTTKTDAPTRRRRIDTRARFGWQASRGHIPNKAQPHT
jgi:hypothetical protein